MPAYILTGAPGAGKTAVLRLLEVIGYPVILALQRRRREAATDSVANSSVFFDRSPVCTLALSRYLGFEPPESLVRETGRVVAERTYETTVFFIRNQGSVRNTAARRISFEDSLDFERVHEKTYLDLGFRHAGGPAGPLARRAAVIEQAIGQRA
ncbi:MAG: AAA family ATPase [Trebonia sp.]